MHLIIKIIFGLIGLGLTVGAFFEFKDVNVFLAEAMAAEGTVVEVVEDRSPGRSTTYRPVVQFIDQNDQEVKFTSSIGSGRSSYSKDQKVKVAYLSSDSQRAKINDFGTLWLMPIGFFLMGIVFLSIGILTALAEMPKFRNNEFLEKWRNNEKKTCANKSRKGTSTQVNMKITPVGGVPVKLLMAGIYIGGLIFVLIGVIHCKIQKIWLPMPIEFFAIMSLPIIGLICFAALIFHLFLKDALLLKKSQWFFVGFGYSSIFAIFISFAFFLSSVLVIVFVFLALEIFERKFKKVKIIEAEI